MITKTNKDDRKIKTDESVKQLLQLHYQDKAKKYIAGSLGISKKNTVKTYPDPIASRNLIKNELKIVCFLHICRFA